MHGVGGASGMHMHLRGDQWKPRTQRAFSTHCGGGAQSCSVHTPSAGVQMPQLSLQQTSPLPHALGPHAIVSAGHSMRQWRGHIVPGGHDTQIVRQPALRAARDSRVPSISGEPGSLDPQPTTWVANTSSASATSLQAFMMLPSPAFRHFLLLLASRTQQVLLGSAATKAAPA